MGIHTETHIKRSQEERTTFQRLHCFRILFTFCLYILLRNCNKSREHFSKAKASCAVSFGTSLWWKNVKYFYIQQRKPLPGGKLFAGGWNWECLQWSHKAFFAFSSSHPTQLRYQCSFHNTANKKSLRGRIYSIPGCGSQASWFLWNVTSVVVEQRVSSASELFTVITWK